MKPKYAVGDVVSVNTVLAKVISIDENDEGISDYLVVPCDGVTYLGNDSIPDPVELSGWYLEPDLGGAE